MKILAISGSLRSQSSNTAILRAAKVVAASGIEIDVFDRLGALPHFNADFDEVGVPEPVARFRAQVAAADALIISSPEYAHGVPGSLKNALDWLVGDTRFAGKHVALIGLEGRAEYAQAALRETLRTMAAQFVEPACIALPHRARVMGVDALIEDPEVAASLRDALSALVHEHEAR
jgi:NAD(P)H-dependent FMN reductase